MASIKELQDLVHRETTKLKFGDPQTIFTARFLHHVTGRQALAALLVLLSYQLKKDDPEKIVKAALAVEVFHNFTLMHDDIMDKAPLRRGKPTVHEKWNETIAILSGDTMLVKAYDLLLNCR